MNKRDRDIRQYRSTATRFQTREEGGDLYVEGYFAVFGERYEMWPGAAETILPGAFRNTLSGDVRGLVNHDTTLVLGRTKAGTLELREDEKGLWGRIKINRDDQDAMNLYSRIQRGDVDQCSFGFDIVAEKYLETESGVLWSVREVVLYEVSVVTFPAYEATHVQARQRDFDTIQQRKTAAWQQTMTQKLKGD